MTTYAEVRNQIQSGDLILLSHKQWKTVSDIESQIVRAFTQSEFSHVCVAWVVGGRVFAIESVVPKVRVMPVSNMLEENDGFYWIHMPDKPMTEAELEFGLKHVGLGDYSKLEAVEGYLDLLDIGSSHDWFCGEYTICMRRLSGVDLGAHATPSAVAKNALSKGYTMKYILKDT